MGFNSGFKGLNTYKQLCLTVLEYNLLIQINTTGCVTSEFVKWLKVLNGHAHARTQVYAGTHLAWRSHHLFSLKKKRSFRKTWIALVIGLSSTPYIGTQIKWRSGCWHICGSSGEIS